MTEEKFKEKVTEKFGSLTRFAKTIDIQVLDIYALFRMKDSDEKSENLAALFNLAEKVEVKPFENDWRIGLGKKIRIAIISDYDTVLNFSSLYSQYTNSWLSLVMNDKRKVITPKIKRLCDLLGVDYKPEKEKHGQ